MPNHTANILMAAGTDAGPRIRKYTRRFNPDASKDSDGNIEEPDTLDLQLIVPMPKEIEDIQSGSSTDNGLGILRYRRTGDAGHLNAMLSWPWVVEKGIKDIQTLIDMLIELDPKCISMAEASIKAQEMYGAKDWYDWSVQYWGTKWNAYDGFIQDEKGSDWIALYFETAWSPPDAALVALKGLEPDLTLLEICADEGGSFLGAYEILGEDDFVYLDQSQEWDSVVGKYLLHKLGRGHGRPPRSFKAPDESREWSWIMELKCRKYE